MEENINLPGEIEVEEHLKKQISEMFNEWIDSQLKHSGLNAVPKERNRLINLAKEMLIGLTKLEAGRRLKE